MEHGHKNNDNSCSSSHKSTYLTVGVVCEDELDVDFLFFLVGSWCRSYNEESGITDCSGSCYCKKLQNVP